MTLSDEQRKALEADIEYIRTMQKMDGEIIEKRNKMRNGEIGVGDEEKGKAEMTSVVPVGGLIMARFHILECEHSTALLHWAKKRSKSVGERARDSEIKRDNFSFPNLPSSDDSAFPSYSNPLLLSQCVDLARSRVFTLFSSDDLSLSFEEQMSAHPMSAYPDWGNSSDSPLVRSGRASSDSSESLWSDSVPTEHFGFVKDAKVDSPVESGSPSGKKNKTEIKSSPNPFLTTLSTSYSLL